jgi:competence protein ComEA
MKPLLPRDRATSAIPARSSLAARLGVWARESLLARGMAIVLGLVLLAMIGGSALAGGSGARASPPAAALPAPSASTVGTTIETSADAGAIPTTRPELLPRAPPELAAEPTEAIAASPGPNVTRATPDDPVDLNTARVDDLRRLPGIGAKRAEAILALRARLPQSHFHQIEDLLKVKGIGRSMLKRLHPLVRLSGT